MGIQVHMVFLINALVLGGIQATEMDWRQAGGGREVGAAEHKAFLISEIGKAGMDEPSGTTIRTIYVAQLAAIDSSLQDRELVDFFLDLIRHDGNEWVRLEAAADIGDLRIPEDMLEEVGETLEKCRKHEMVNFQVLAARSKVKVGKKRNNQELTSLKSLARIARGEGEGAWKIMIPPHNRNTVVPDPNSKRKIPFEVFFKTEMRLMAIDGLAVSNDDFVKAALKELAKSPNERVKQKALETERMNNKFGTPNVERNR